MFVPHAPRIPVCSLSAPAHDNILLIRTTWYGWARTRRWKPSFPATFTRYLDHDVSIYSQVVRKKTYLLAQMRAASRASEDSCSYSLETMWTQRGKSSTLARLRPRSKIRIFGSGTPLLKRDLGYGYRHVMSSYSRKTFQSRGQVGDQSWSTTLPHDSTGKDTSTRVELTLFLQ